MTGRKPAFNRATEEKIVKVFKQGVGIGVLSERFCVTQKTIKRVLYRNGVTGTSPRLYSRVDESSGIGEHLMHVPENEHEDQ